MIEIDHKAGSFAECFGISEQTAITLRKSIKKWNEEERIRSKTVDLILSHETLNENERIYCLISLGELYGIETISDKLMIDSLSSIFEPAQK